MHKRGFTLIELMIVVAIIALIAAIATPNLMRARESAKRAVCVANREALQRAEQLFLSQNERHSDSIEELRTTGLYHGAKCPKAGVYFWVEFPGLDDFYQRIMGCSVHGVDTDTDENEQIFTLTLLSSDFSDRGQWQIVSGDWVFKDGVAVSKLNSENRAFSGSEEWRDYVVSTDARIVAGKGLGIYFRATDVKQVDGYIFQVDPGLGNKFVFRKLVNGKESAPFAVAAPEGPFDWYAKHNIQIKVEGDTFTAYIDDKEVLRSSDTQYETGMVGIRAWSGGQAEFDNLDVKEQK